MSAVLDAGAAVDVLLDRPGTEALVAALLRADALHAPELFYCEAASALRKLESLDKIAPSRAAEAIVDLLALPLHRHPHAPLVTRMWQLRNNFSSYDATYVALAERLGQLPLITSDQRLATAARTHTDIEVITP